MNQMELHSMNDYTIHLKSIGSMTQVPDSQKLFGALIYKFVETYGDKLTTLFTNAIKDKEIHLALSNVLPKGYLPTPQDFLIDNYSSKSEKDDAKQVRKAIKTRCYIKEDAIHNILNPSCFNFEEYSYVKEQNLQQLRASIDSIRYQISGLDSNLYSVPTIVLTEVIMPNEKIEYHEMKEVKDFCFYLQIDDSELCRNFYNMLASSINETLVLGKRASQGLNLFEIKKVENNNVKQTDSTPSTFLNTGMLLPEKDTIDFDESSLKLFTSERRPFEIVGGWGKQPKYFISFLAEGSIIKTSKSIKAIGKSVNPPYRKRDIVFGNAYLYPLHIKEGSTKQ